MASGKLVLQKNLGPSLTCFEKTAMSSLKDSDEQTSPPMTDGSLGVQVASSHFSKMRANRGNNGCLKKNSSGQYYKLGQLWCQNHITKLRVKILLKNI